MKANILFYQEKIYKIEQNPFLDFTAYYNKSKIDKSELLFGLGCENPAHLEKIQKEDLGALYDEKFLRLGMIQEFIRPSEDDFESDDVERPKPTQINIDYVALNDTYKKTHNRSIYELEEIDNISVKQNESQQESSKSISHRAYIPTTILEKEIENLKQKVESQQKVIEHLKTQDYSPKVSETTPTHMMINHNSDDCSTPSNGSENSTKVLQDDSISSQEIQDMSTTMLSSFFKIEEKIQALKAKRLASVKKVLSFETPVITPNDQSKVTLEHKIEIPENFKAKAKALIEKMTTKTGSQPKSQSKIEKGVKQLSFKKPKVESKKESKSKIAPTSFYSPKSQFAPAVKGKNTIKVHVSSVSRTSALKTISKNSPISKMSKTSQVFLTKDTSKGITIYRDQYGWFTVITPKKQNPKSSNNTMINFSNPKGPIQQWVPKPT